jgi:hypothetical protein
MTNNSSGTYDQLMKYTDISTRAIYIKEISSILAESEKGEKSPLYKA